jgi:hypothetical protein
MVMFEHKRAWIDHEMEKHWRSWSCYLCNFMSNQQSDVESHLVRSHPNMMSESENATIYITSRPLDYIDTSRCMLCDWDKVLLSKGSVTVVSRESFMGHLAHHLEQLALFALARERPGENSGSIKSNHAAHHSSRASQNAGNSSLAGDESSIESATKEDTEKPSALTHQTFDNQSSTFITISQAFPSQSQDRDATLAWMTRTESHDLEHITESDEAMEQYNPHDEIRRIAMRLLDVSSKLAVRVSHKAKHAFLASRAFDKTIKGISAQMVNCGLRIARTFVPVFRNVLDDCIAIMSELQALVVEFGKDVESTKRTWETIKEGISEAQHLLAAALESDSLRQPADEKLPQDQSDETPTPDEIMPVATNPSATTSVVDTTPYMTSDSRETQDKACSAVEMLRSMWDDDLASLNRNGRPMATPDDVAVEERNGFMEELMEEIQYPGMLVKQQSIRPPLINTFGWIYDNPSFLNFLLDPDKSMFWVTGKPGSGKSTVMRMIEDDRRTLEHLLRGSADGRPWCIVSFYFHGRGSSLQKSIEGLLRSLLCQLIQYDSAAVFLSIAAEIGPYDDWTREDLDSALKRALSRFRHVLLIVDGLDECEDGVCELLAFVHSLSELFDFHHDQQTGSTYKICVANEHGDMIEEVVGRLSDLVLHELNAEDISTFVGVRLSRWASENGIPEDHVRTLIEHSEGSFIEAALLVDRLKSSIPNQTYSGQ